MSKKQKILFQVIPAVILLVLISVIVINAVEYSGINKIITVEAGTALPAASVFLKDAERDAIYASDISTIDINVVGEYAVKIKSGNSIYNVKIHIKDTTAPSAIVKPLDLYECTSVQPEDFIESISDASEVKVSFKASPDITKKSSQQVIILLEDEHGNQSEYETTLRISKLLDSVTVEASKIPLDYRRLLKNAKDAEVSRFPENQFIPDKPGTFPISISINDEIFDCNIEVVDTVKPKGTPVDRTIWVNENIEATAFVTDISDITKVDVSFKKDPDLTRVGQQEVTISLKDEAGNETSLSATLTINEDKEPPIIYGVQDKTIFIGDSVSYKKNVYATDNKDGDVSVSVDSSAVNLKKEGSYKVIYSATDSSGNTAIKEVTYTVKEFIVTMEMLEKLADEILARITTENMTLREKAWEIYKYVNKHISYTGVSDKSDWMKEAYNGIKKGVGDCFTYYSMSELLLNRIGLQTLSVERLRKPGDSRHYWHMVNYGEGWYHFDACIHNPPFVSFMVTDAELDAYSELRGKDNYYYRYDRSKYPATPEN